MLSTPIYILPHLKSLSQIGSSLTFSAQGGRGKEKIVSAEKTFCRSEDGSAGGGWGEECRAVRAWKPRRTARILGGRNRAEISLSFFEFFSGGARKRKIVRENFCEVAAGAIAEAGGGAVSSVQKMFEQSCIIPPLESLALCSFSEEKGQLTYIPTNL